MEAQSAHAARAESEGAETAETPVADVGGQVDDDALPSAEKASAAAAAVMGETSLNGAGPPMMLHAPVTTSPGQTRLRALAEKMESIQNKVQQHRRTQSTTLSQKVSLLDSKLSRVQRTESGRVDTLRHQVEELAMVRRAPQRGSETSARRSCVRTRETSREQRKLHHAHHSHAHALLCIFVIAGSRARAPRSEGPGRSQAQGARARAVEPRA